MHELSIASSLLDLARRHVPPGNMLTGVRVLAGPMRGIEPDAMQFAWQAVVDEAELASVQLTLDILPWRTRCPKCGWEWASDEMTLECAWGCGRVHPIGGDELQIRSIEVDEIWKGALTCASL